MDKSFFCYGLMMFLMVLYAILLYMLMKLLCNMTRQVIWGKRLNWILNKKQTLEAVNLGRKLFCWFQCWKNCSFFFSIYWSSWLPDNSQAIDLNAVWPVLQEKNNPSFLTSCFPWTCCLSVKCDLSFISITMEDLYLNWMKWFFFLILMGYCHQIFFRWDLYSIQVQTSTTTRHRVTSKRIKQRKASRKGYWKEP